MITHSLKGLQGSKGIFIQQEKISVIKNTTGFFLICKERLDEKVKYLSPEVDGEGKQWPGSRGRQGVRRRTGGTDTREERGRRKEERNERTKRKDKEAQR